MMMMLGKPKMNTKEVDELFDTIQKFVQTMIDLDDDKRRFDYRTLYERTETQYKPLAEKLKKQLYKIDMSSSSVLPNNRLSNIPHEDRM